MGSGLSISQIKVYTVTMSRPLRIEYPGAVYHVTSRGNGQADIYLENKDYEGFLNLFGGVCERYRWRCYAYCLMDNHYHLVIETPEGNLSRGMRQLNGMYTQAFNRRCGRVGHVLQGRYKGIIVDKESYLLELARYVVLNPVRAGMVRAAVQWRWSSYRSMTGQAKPPKWLDTGAILGQFAKQRKRARERYIEFVREGRNMPKIWEHLRNQVFLGDDTFVEQLQKEHLGNRKAMGNTLEVPDVQRRKPVRALSWYGDRYKEKKRAIVEAYLSGGYTLKDVGEYFGMHYTTVSRIVKAWESM